MYQRKKTMETAICLTVLLCATAAMAGYPRVRYHSGGHKLHLGGAAYAHHPVKYTSHGLSYRKPVLHYATPIVYAHKSYSKPKVTHYISKPSYGHEVYHHAPVYRSKPVYYLGGHASHGLAYKPLVHHAPTYLLKSHH